MSRLDIDYNTGAALLASLFLPFVSKPKLSTHLDVLVAMAGLGLPGHVFLTRIFNAAPVSVIVPFEYSVLVWAALLVFWYGATFPPNTCFWGREASLSAASTWFVGRRRARAGGRRNLSA